MVRLNEKLGSYAVKVEFKAEGVFYIPRSGMVRGSNLLLAGSPLS